MDMNNDLFERKYKKSLDDNLKKRDDIATATLRSFCCLKIVILKIEQKKETLSLINKFYYFFKIWLKRKESVDIYKSW